MNKQPISDPKPPSLETWRLVGLYGSLVVLLLFGVWNSATSEVGLLPKAVPTTSLTATPQADSEDIPRDLGEVPLVLKPSQLVQVKTSIAQAPPPVQDPPSVSLPILYVPLDNRPPNWLPCVWGIVVCPPAVLYGGRDGVDPGFLKEWLDTTSGSKLVVSLDALSYGGLVQGRLPGISVEETLGRMELVRAWQNRTGGEVLAFGVIPRYPDARNRERNLEVLQDLEEWIGERFYLEATWDDALPGSPAVREASRIPYFSRPGADETGQILLLRALRPGLKVRVVYDDLMAANQLTRYEGLPLGDTVQRMLDSAGAERVEQDPELALLVYTGRNPRGAVLSLLRESRTNMVAVADVSRANRGDPALMDYLLKMKLYAKLAAYASWGTMANNIGSALAQGGLFLEDQKRREEALAESYVQYLWSEVGRPWVRERFPEPLSEEAGRYVLEHLRAEPLIELGGPKLELLALKFPWRRSFEASLEYRLVQPEGPGVER